MEMIIKKYGNRKLYLTHDTLNQHRSGYISQVEAIGFIKDGYSLTFIDHNTKEDITEKEHVNMLLTLIENESKTNHIPIQVVTDIIKANSLIKFLVNRGVYSSAILDVYKEEKTLKEKFKEIGELLEPTKEKITLQGGEQNDRFEPIPVDNG